MSLRGYVKKGKPAPWTQMPGALTPKMITQRAALDLLKSIKRGLKASERGWRKRGRVAPMSKARRRDSAKYRVLRLDFLRENPRCMRCGAPATCIHHHAGRRTNYLRVETWRASCNACNIFAKEHPTQARRENWIAPAGVYKV